MLNKAAILNYIIGHKRQYDGLSPTIREICQTFGSNSTSIVRGLLTEMEEAGVIRRRGKRPGIMVTGGKWTHLSDEEPGEWNTYSEASRPDAEECE